MSYENEVVLPEAESPRCSWYSVVGVVIFPVLSAREQAVFDHSPVHLSVGSF